MRRKILSTTLAVIGILITGLAILTFLGLFKEQVSGILIEADPISTVYINNVEVGKTPYESNIKAGGISIKIKPESTYGADFDDYETKVNLVPGVRTIVKRSFKADEENSSGIIVSFEKIGGQESYVTAVSIPDGAQISIDDKSYGYTPLRVKIPAGNHTLSISSSNYTGKSLPIKIYKGFNLTASVKLAKDEPRKNEDTILGANVLNLGRIKINKNNLGYIAARSGANVGFPEIGQVMSDEVYDVLEEGEKGKWLKIKFGDIEGWVGAESVTKI